jgi:hypothetical protein
MADATDNLEDRIAIARRNIEDLTAQATGASGAAAEESIAARISDQQDMLNALLRQQEGRERTKST